MEVFMLSVQVFAAAYGANLADNPKYTARIMDNMETCQKLGNKLTIITDMAHAGMSQYYFKCVLRQGV